MTVRPAPQTEQGFTERKAPELVTFDKPGSRIAGRLLAVSQITIENKPVTQFILSNEKDVFKVLGTYDLTQKINRRDVGALVIIEYLGEDERIKSKGHAMRVFHVQVKRDDQSKTFADGSPITDEDIPF